MLRNTIQYLRTGTWTGLWSGLGQPQKPGPRLPTLDASGHLVLIPRCFVIVPDDSWNMEDKYTNLPFQNTQALMQMKKGAQTENCVCEGKVIQGPFDRSQGLALEDGSLF